MTIKIIQFDTIEEMAEYEKLLKAKKPDTVAHVAAAQEIVDKLPSKQSHKFYGVKGSYITPEMENTVRAGMKEWSNAQAVKLAKVLGLKRNQVHYIFYSRVYKRSPLPQIDTKLPKSGKVIVEHKIEQAKQLLDGGAPTYVKVAQLAKMWGQSSVIVRKFLSNHRVKIGYPLERLRRRYSTISDDERAKVKGFYEKHRDDDDYIAKRDKFMQDNNMKMSRFYTALGGTGTMLQRKAGHWSKIKQISATDPKQPIEQVIEKAKSGGYGKVKPEELEFPQIYPLAEHSVRVFEQMLVDLIAKKHSKIDYYIASNNLQLIDGKEWGYPTWMQFCQQVILNNKNIAKALVGCDGAKLHLKREGYSHIIRYG